MFTHSQGGKTLRLFATTLVVIVVLTSLLKMEGANSAMPIVLNGSVGPDYVISLTKGGFKVKSLKAGTYTVKVWDKGTRHNFHLTGFGVNKATSVSRTGHTTWTVTFRKGSYRYMCDPHASSMRGSFMVTK